MELSELLSKIYSIDDFDYSQYSGESRKCALCYKPFIPRGRNARRQRYCERTHYIDCLVCGTPIPQPAPIDVPGGLKKACCKQCSSKLKISGLRSALVNKYGHENPSQIEEFKPKISESLRKGAPERTKKVMATMRERYGGMGTQSPMLRQKIESTMIERYGITNPDQSPEFRNKISAALKSPECIQKKIESSQAKYGTDYPAQSEEVQAAMQRTTMEHWGVPFAGQIAEARERAQQTNLARYGTACTLNTPKAREKARQSMKDNRTGRSSHINREFGNLLDAEGISFEEEFYLDGKWFDFRITGTNILIELNPSYTHSTVPSHWEQVGKEKGYHLARTQLAESYGFRCIHIFEWDNWNAIVDLLKASEVIYARKCNVEEISAFSVDEFITSNHLQGNARGAKYAYGLHYGGNLVEVMTFGKPRYNRNYQWELLRLCTQRDLKVVGGASRLFNHFIKDVHPESIISYCDTAKFSGKVYTELGMVLHHTSDPAKVWSKGDKYITDNLLRQRGFDQLFHTDYGKGTSNEQLMIDAGWLPVYDCGQKVFEWRSI